MTTTLINPSDRKILELVEDVLLLNPDIKFGDIETLVVAAKAGDRVEVYEKLLAKENRPAMVRALEAGLRCATRGGVQ